MDNNEEQSLDSEYKRYLEIMRPYLCQLLDQDVIEICNEWIQRLSLCKQNEKVRRNKYIFAMCYQLAKGILEEPFLRNPTSDELAPLQEGTITDNSVNESSEVECLVLDLDSTKTKVLYKTNNILSPEITRSSHLSETDQSIDSFGTNNKTSVNSTSKQSAVKGKHTVVCYNCPNIIPRFPHIDVYNENIYEDNEYEHRATNLIMKLREIKTQNVMLHNELIALREDAILKHEYVENEHNNIIKVHNATSAHIRAEDSTTTLNCLKSKLQELQNSRKSLIETIRDLQEQLDNVNEINRHEIEDLLDQHKLEIIQLKTSMREELKADHAKNLEELKHQHEQLLKSIQCKHLQEIETLTANKESTIAEKDKIIQSMQTEISDLKNFNESLKNNQYFMFSNFLDNNDFSAKCMTQKTEELERRLNKMEKSKIKCCQAYEAKLANLQKEKHLAESSFQLQLMKQRTKLINETDDDHQTELATTLDKLENKYKDIVANVQATAVQRRIQDQMALDSLIQTVCGVRNEGLHCNMAQATYTSQLSNNDMRNEARDANQSGDSELPTNNRDNNVGSVIVGNRAFACQNTFCLEGNKLNALFERVCVPQRDTGANSPKK